MKRRILIGALVVAVIVAGSFVYEGATREPAGAASETTPTYINAFLVIEGVLPKANVRVPEGSALALLTEVSKEQSFALKTKEYQGMGTLVEKIGEFENGTDGKYWHYYVNNLLAPVGADAYKVKEGDVIEWRFHTPDESL